MIQLRKFHDEQRLQLIEEDICGGEPLTSARNKAAHGKQIAEIRRGIKEIAAEEKKNVRICAVG